VQKTQKKAFGMLLAILLCWGALLISSHAANAYVPICGQNECCPLSYCSNHVLWVYTSFHCEYPPSDSYCNYTSEGSC
jgi:hypothetical protein